MKYPSIILSLFLTLMSPVVVRAENVVQDIEQLDFAHGLFQRGLYEMALSEYRKFIRAYPQSQSLAEAYFGLAESSFFLKRYQDSVKQYQEYLHRFAQAERKDLAFLRIGQAFFFMDQWQDALQNFLKVSAESLTKEFRQVLFFYMGKVYQAQKDYQQALVYFKKSLDVDPENPQAPHTWLAMADVHQQMRAYEQAIEDYARAYALAHQPRIKSYALFRQAEVLFLKQDYAAAADLFKRLIETYPQQELVGQARINLFTALFNQGHYQQITRIFTQEEYLFLVDPQWFDLHYIAASAYVQLEQYDKAEQVLDVVFTLDHLTDEQKRKMRLKKLETLVKAERFQEALYFIEKESETLSQQADQVMFFKAESLYGLKRFSEAYAAYQEIINNYPDSPLASDALYGAAHAQNALGRAQQALELFERHVRQAKDADRRAEALYNAIVIAKNQKMFDKAVTFGQQYMSDFSQKEHAPKVGFWLGMFYVELKQYKKAIEAFEKFIQQYPRSVYLQEARFLLAYSLQASGDLDRALAIYGLINDQQKQEDLVYSSLKNTALIYLEQKQEEKAAAILDRMVMRFSDHDLDKTTVFWLVQRYLSEHKFQDVLRILQKLGASFEGEDAQAAAYFQGRAYQELQDYAKAIEAYEEVIKGGGKSAYVGLARLEKGICLIAMDHFLAARKELEGVLLDYPQENTLAMRSRFELANIAKALKEYDRAAKLYMLVAVLYEDEFYSPEALFQAGELFELLNRSDEAKKVFAEILQDYPRSEAAGKVMRKNHEN